MIFGNLNDVFDGEQTIYEAIQQNTTDYKKPTFVGELLQKLSHYGMSYSEDVYKNMHAIPANPDLIPQDYEQIVNLYGNSVREKFRIQGEEEKTYAEKTVDQKRQVLRKMAQQPELEDILDIMANESIVYDAEQSYICQPFIDTAIIQMLNEENAERIRNAMDVNFTKLYMLLEWKTKAWDIYKRYLTDGVLAYEIVYDNLENPKIIIGIVELDPATLTKSYENGQIYWYQYKGIQNKERKLIDAQIIYVKYEDSGVVERTSYLERLIRPFNIYRIIEQAQIIWTVTQSSFKTMFTIPVNGMNRAKGTQTLMAAMNRYKEDIKFISDTGELTINGQVNMPFNKEYWMPDNENGTPEIETVSGDGPELNDNDQLKFFKNILYKISKIPLNRFDQESGEAWFGTDASSYARSEIDFGRYVNRLRNPFSQIILKPLQIQLCLDIPELADQKEFLDCIQLHYKSYNLFEELMEMDLMQKRVEFIQTMKDGMVDMDQEGNEIKFWSSEFLVKKYLHLSDADLELNKKLKEEEIKSLNLAGGDGGEEYDMSGFESLRLEDRKMLLEMLEYAKKRAQVNESEEKKKKVKKVKKEEEQGEEPEQKEEE